MSALFYRLHQTGRGARDFTERYEAIAQWRHATTQVEDGESTSLYAVRESKNEEELLAHYQPVPHRMV
jgi:hypothetical protein